jgi:hypothetical protein
LARNDHARTDRNYGLLDLNRELTALEGKTHEASRQRAGELLDELINLDMSFGPVRKAMGGPAKPKPRTYEGEA